jgi:hypothetical protein
VVRVRVRVMPEGPVHKVNGCSILVSLCSARLWSVRTAGFGGASLSDLTEASDFFSTFSSLIVSFSSVYLKTVFSRYMR